MIGIKAREVVAHGSRLLSRDLVPIQELRGGEHATTVLVTEHDSEFVLRAFPEGDRAVEYEVQVLARLTALGFWVPQLVAYVDDGDGPPVILTTKVQGERPPTDLPFSMMAQQMARALAAIHQQSGEGLRVAPTEPPAGAQPIVDAAQREWPRLIAEERVLTHYDYWCGNALWVGNVLTGVVDWSGARLAPRGLDLAWCRQDLVLLGSPAAADLFLHEYEHAADCRIPNIRAWDINAAAQAIASVEDWAPNYHAIGRLELTPVKLRQRLSHWVDHLLKNP